ncbi:cysteine proteinase [Coniophora puteana RWD-64-598 SS2]|uniref:Cysteine proteinase n=1 Tax=Coniophora puteana (strain RWD-64-598) TaxID=741705 RepID=A0A5M3MMX5_CONPW|nr:cysteine proteinase [Coniophora puteana RWD-64-598 SS2]EIW80539.1 cysteine proteinase [Coniophora puteana RWD-64-598 SS2]
MASKSVDDIEASLAKAAQAELRSDWDQAFNLYARAADRAIHLSRDTTDDQARARLRQSARRALDRAEKIKRARPVAPLPADPFSPQQQAAVLARGAVVNGVRMPLWTDPAPPLQDRDAHVSLAPEQMARGATWKRPSEFLTDYTTASTSGSGGDEDAPDPRGVRQSVVNDCSVCASVAVCVDYQRRFKSTLLVGSLHPQDASGLPIRSASGEYALRAFLNGAYRRVILNDRVPVDSEGCLLGVSLTHRHCRVLWPALVEKAYMKITGGYDFPGSNSGVDLHVLTGWIPEHLEIKSSSFEWERTWRRLRKGFTEGHCVITVGTTRDAVPDPRFLPAHAYAVIDLSESGDSRRCTLLDSRVAEEDEKRLDPDDYLSHCQVYELEWEEVCNIFGSVHISWDPALFSQSLAFHGAWHATSATGGRQSSTHRTRHLLLQCGPSHDTRHRPCLSESRSSSSCSSSSSRENDGGSDEVWVLLTRHLRNTRKHGGYIALNTQSQDAGVGPGDLSRIASKGTYTDSSHLLVRTRVGVQSNVLSLLACFDEPDNPVDNLKAEDVGFTITAYARFSLSWDTRAAPPAHTSKIDGIFSSKNAGGNPSCPTYMLNPQYYLRLHPTSSTSPSSTRPARLVPTASQSRVKAPEGHRVTITAYGSREMPLNLVLVWSQGERVIELSRKEIVANSGAYVYGSARISTSLPTGSYTLVLSAFDASQMGDFSIQIESEARFDCAPIAQEGAGMYNRIVRGEWSSKTAAGGPSNGKYADNPVYEIRMPIASQFGARLHFVTPSPSSSLNVSIFSSPRLASDECVATSGPYSDAISGVDIPPISLAAGRYYMVPSTYNGGLQGKFKIVVYHSSAGVAVSLREGRAQD